LKKFVIDEKNSGQKLFRFIKNVLPQFKNSDIFKLVRKKVVKINDKKTEPDYILSAEDVVEIFLNDTHFEHKAKKKKFQSVNSNIDVVFEDKDILVINKPKGLLSQPADGDYKNSVYEMARSYLYAKGEYDPKGAFTPALCHRLDKNTSGLLVIAKNHAALQNVTAMLRERKTFKSYKTIVSGKIDKSFFVSSVIDASAEKVRINSFKKSSNTPPDKIVFLMDNPELSAIVVNPELTENGISLVNVDLWTGKKHQIRVQLTESGYPLLGDWKYFNSNSIKKSEELKVSSYFLHAYKLKLENYPEFTAELPKDFFITIKLLFRENQ